MLLSILIPTLPERAEKLGLLIKNLSAQANRYEDVEILVLPDNRGMLVGEKRNRLVQLAAGEYIAFIDDDDKVSNDYVDSIVKALKAKPDVVCFHVSVMWRGRQPRICRYHPSFKKENLEDSYRRPANHLMVWRKVLAKRIPFPTTSLSEASKWAMKMVSVTKQINCKVSVIDRVLYTYCDAEGNSRRNRLRASRR